MKEKTQSKKNWFISELPSLILILALVLTGRSVLADHYYVPSGSMEYTLLPGDRVFVDKRAYGFRIPFTTIDLIPQNKVGRGEIVIFDSPNDGTRLIKRIVAVGGDQVVLQNGLLSINGDILINEDGFEEFGSRLAELNLSHGGGANVDMTIPDDHVLAIGDHRGASKDGRFFGVVPESDIYGRAVAVYYRKGDGFRWKKL